MLAFGDLVLYLAVYSFIGYLVEVLYVFATTQKLENRGFLTGPFLPIYGFGAVIIIVAVLPFVKNPFLAFVASVVVTSALEYVTHLVLDKVFHIKLWDYSDKPFNLHGRICLQNSLLFGVLAMFLIYVLHPAVSKVVEGLPPAAVIAIASALLALLVVDAANSFASLAKVRPVLDRMKGSLDQVHAKIEADARRDHAEHASRRSAFERQRHASIGRLSRAFPGAHSSRAEPAKP